MRPGGHGTGRQLGINASYSMAGKSGTVQLVSIAQGARYDAQALKKRHRAHALFIAFAPVDDPQIAIAVVVENGELGAKSAGPIVRQVFDAYFDHNYIRRGNAVPELGSH